MISLHTLLWLAVTFLVGEALVIAGLLAVMERRERGFGAFADIVRDTHTENKMIHNENMLVRQDNLRLFDQLDDYRKRLPPPPTEKIA